MCGYKEKTKQSCKSNKKTREHFNNCINKQKKENVLIIVLVSMRMYMKLRSKKLEYNMVKKNEHKRYTPVDPFTWTNKGWIAS